MFSSFKRNLCFLNEKVCQPKKQGNIKLYLSAEKARKHKKLYFSLFIFETRYVCLFWELGILNKIQWIRYNNKTQFTIKKIIIINNKTRLLMQAYAHIHIHTRWCVGTRTSSPCWKWPKFEFFRTSTLCHDFSISKFNF